MAEKSRRDGIHVFEDEEFLSAVSRGSLVIFVAGTVLGIAWFALLRPALPGLAPVDIAGLFDAVTSPGKDGVDVLGVLLPLAIWFAVTVASFALHEVVHAIPMKLFAPAGSRVTFGMNRETWMLYACADGIVYPRRAYQLIIALPTVVVTLALLLGGEVAGYSFAGYILAIVHLSGCTADLAYLAHIARDRAISACEDTTWGVRFIHEDPGSNDR